MPSTDRESLRKLLLGGSAVTGSSVPSTVQVAVSSSNRAQSVPPVEYWPPALL